MADSGRRSLHPLLFERSYWRNRLEEMNAVGRSLLCVPRPDLSTPSVEVEEFRIRAHDGIRLWGLFARSTFHRVGQAARIRVVGPCERPEIDRGVVEGGCADIVLQAAVGRRLEDRVLDVVRIFQFAANSDGIDRARVSFAGSDPGAPLPDEILIAQQLVQDDVCEQVASALRAKTRSIPPGAAVAETPAQPGV
jgi:hypothetical protein